MIVLDVMLPRMTGTDVCRTLRAESDVPIIMLTARDAEVDRVLGLELGADDYVTKPFSTAELASRVRALLRRRALDRQATDPTTIDVGGIRIDLSRHAVTVDGRPVQLTLSEFKLLTLLAQEPERVFQRRQIMEHLWDSPFVGDARACDVHISDAPAQGRARPGQAAAARHGARHRLQAARRLISERTLTEKRERSKRSPAIVPPWQPMAAPGERRSRPARGSW